MSTAGSFSSDKPLPISAIVHGLNLTSLIGILPTT
jgi:hypothetical protein